MIWLAKGYVLMHALLLMNGCAVNTVGVVTTDISVGQGAVTLDLMGAGIVLHRFPGVSGVTLGVSRLTMVYERALDGELEYGRHWFYAPVPAGEPVAIDRRVYGLDLQLVEPPTIPAEKINLYKSCDYVRFSGALFAKIPRIFLVGYASV